MIVALFLTLFIFIWGFTICFISNFKKEKNNKKIINNDFSFTSIVCAHNEEKCINKVLDDLCNQTYKNNDIYVVLDNCIDNTYDIVCKYEKVNIINKKSKSTCKGDALNYAYDYLKSNNKLNDVIVIFDADCKIDNDLLFNLNNKYKSGSNVVMVNTDALNPYDNVISSWYTLYWKMVSMLSRDSHRKLNLSCNISGCGISFKNEYYFKTKTITEDVEYFFVFSSKNIKIDYINNSKVYQEQPTTFKQMLNQLYRWTNGIRFVNKKYMKSYFKSLISDFSLMKFDALITSLTCSSLGLLVILIILSCVFYGFLNIYLLFLLISSFFTGIIIMLKDKLKFSKMFLGILTYFVFLLILGLVYDYSVIRPSNKWVSIDRKEC